MPTFGLRERKINTLHAFGPRVAEVGLESSRWVALLALHVLFYLLAVVGLVAPATRGARVVAIPMYFTLMNAAFAVGLLRTVAGRADGQWALTKRTQLRAP